MARLRNHQLKVYNQFGGGIQNVPADHLIQEDSFVKAINLDNTDSTIHPLLSGKKVANLLNNANTYIVENIHGNDTELTISPKIQYINYADTIYYLELLDAGSPLNMIVSEYGKSKIALPHIEDTLEAEGQSDSAQGTINIIFQDVVDKLTIYTESIQNSLQETSKAGLGNTWIGNAHSMYDEVLPNMDYFKTPPTVTEDTLQSELQVAKGKLAELITQLDNIKAYTDNDFKTRLIEASLDPAFLTITDRSTDERQDMGADMLELLPNYYHDYNHDSQLRAVAFVAKYRSEVSNALAKIATQSIWKMISRTRSIKWVDANEQVRTSIWTSVYDEAKRVQLLIDKVDEKMDTLTNPPATINDNVSYYTDAVYGALTDEEVRQVMAMWLEVYQYNAEYDKNIFLKYQEGSLEDNQPNFHSITLTQAGIQFVDVHNQTKLVVEELRSTSLDKEDTSTFAEYGLAIYDEETKAYSNMIRSNKVYDKEGVVLTFDAHLHHKGKVYIYRKAGNETNFTEIATYPKVSIGILDTVTLQPPYSQGAVAHAPYRVQEAPTDFISIAEYQGAIFLARKDSQEVWYTDNGAPDMMNMTNFIKMPQNIKAMKSAGAGVFIWTTNDTLYLLTGLTHDSQGHNTLAIKRIADSAPILDNEATVSIDTLVVWMSKQGFHNTSGYGSAQTTSKTWTPKYKITDVIASAVAQHYCYFAVTTPTTTMLIRYETSTQRVLEYDIPDLINLSVVEDELVIIQTGSDDPNCTFCNTASWFGQGIVPIPYDILLKRYAGYSCDVRQRFTNVSVCHAGDEEDTTLVQVYVDGWLAGEETVKGNDVTRIDLPQGGNTGYSIQLGFKGVLNIKSARIRYTTHDWED